MLGVRTPGMGMSVSMGDAWGQDSLGWGHPCPWGMLRVETHAGMQLSVSLGDTRGQSPWDGDIQAPGGYSGSGSPVMGTSTSLGDARDRNPLRRGHSRPWGMDAQDLDPLRRGCPCPWGMLGVRTPWDGDVCAPLSPWGPGG